MEQQANVRSAEPCQQVEGNSRDLFPGWNNLVILFMNMMEFIRLQESYLTEEIKKYITGSSGYDSFELYPFLLHIIFIYAKQPKYGDTIIRTYDQQYIR